MGFTTGIECPFLLELSEGEYVSPGVKAFGESVECPTLLEIDEGSYVAPGIKAFTPSVECPTLIELGVTYVGAGVKSFTRGANLLVSANPFIPGDDSLEIIVGLYIDFNATPLQGTEPLTVQFQNLSSEHFTEWLWNFGDGETDTAFEPVHVYAQIGNYSVSLSAKLATDWYIETKSGWLTVSESIPERYWVANTESNWNNTDNWSTTSGGPGGASVPGPTKDVIFDSNGIGNCLLDTFPTVFSLQNTSYTGTIIPGIFQVIEGPYKYWVSDTSSVWDSISNWDTTSGGPGGAPVPNSTDFVMFNGDGTGLCDINTGPNIRGIKIDVPYSNIVRQGLYDINIGIDGAIIDGGSFEGSSKDITSSGSVKIGLSTFTNSSSNFLIRNNFIYEGYLKNPSYIDGSNVPIGYGAFLPNNGKVILDSSSDSTIYGGGVSFFNLDIKKTGDRKKTYIGGDANIDNDLIVENAILPMTSVDGTNGNLKCYGDATILSSGIMGPSHNTEITFMGGGLQKLSIEEGAILPALTIDKTTSAQVVVYGEDVIINSDFLIRDGTMNTNGRSIFVGVNPS